jgi:type VI secretion system protein ImpK
MLITGHRQWDQVEKPESDENRTNISSSVSHLIFQVLLSKATELARAGYYTEAESSLSEMIQGKIQKPAFLDLLARIRAQQGKLLDAKSLWTQASRLDPTNEAYKAGLERIERVQSRPLWVAWLRTNFPLFIRLAVVIGIFFAGFFMRGNILNFNQSSKGEVAKIAVKRDVPPDLKVTVPGISVVTEMNEIKVRFDSGLFDGGVDITSENKKLLTTFGKQLESHADHILLKVVGHTDNIPIVTGSKYKDNLALGMARAVAVAEHLRTTAKLKSDIFLIGNLGESMAPYPNDTPENRARNRTVTIKISNTGKR